MSASRLSFESFPLKEVILDNPFLLEIFFSLQHIQSDHANRPEGDHLS